MITCIISIFLYFLSPFEDTTQMNKMLWLEEKSGLACFEAGVGGQGLESHLNERGFTLGHEPDSVEFSTLGGW